MNLDIRTILLLLAVVLFVVAIFSATHWDDLVAGGLAAFAAAFLVGEAGLGSFNRRNR